MSEVEGLGAGESNVGDDAVPDKTPGIELGLKEGDVRDDWGVSDDAFNWTTVSAGDIGDADESSGDEVYSAPGAISGDGGEEVDESEVATELL